MEADVYEHELSGADPNKHPDLADLNVVSLCWNKSD